MIYMPLYYGQSTVFLHIIEPVTRVLLEQMPFTLLFIRGRIYTPNYLETFTFDSNQNART